MAVALEKMFTQAEVEKGSFDAEDQSFIAWASRPVIDRDHEIIASDAWDIDNFKKNPVLLWAHDYTKPPIGTVQWVKVQANGLKFKPRFAKTEMGMEIYSLYEDGILNTFSVGFIPREHEDDEDNVKEGEYFNKPLRTHTNVELLEVSCVPVPACPDALIERYANGEIKTKGLQTAIEHVIAKAAVSEPDEEEVEEADDAKTVQTSAGKVSGGWEAVEIEERDPVEIMRKEGLEKAEDGIVPVTVELWNAIMDAYMEIAAVESIEENEEVIETAVDEHTIEYTHEEFELMVQQELKIKKQAEAIRSLSHNLAVLAGQIKVLRGGSG